MAKKKHSEKRSSKKWRVGIAGANGRMGRSLMELLLAQEKAVLAAGLLRPSSPDWAEATVLIEAQGGKAVTDVEALFSQSDIVLDFSHPLLTLDLVRQAEKEGVPLVIGTTGHTASQLARIKKASGKVPVLLAPNTSIGIALLAKAVHEFAALLNSDWDIEICEMHHRKKQDAPSGTALHLGQAAARGRGGDLSKLSAIGNRGGLRKKGTIGFASLRGGDVTGEHTILFARPGERLELAHKVTDRRIFAAGALEAGLWLVRQKPGFYGMAEMLKGTGAAE